MKWSKLFQGGSIPATRSSHTINNVGSKLYIFGGEHDPRVPIDNDVHAYDLGSGEWEKLGTSGDSPAARVGHTAAVVGPHIYIFGGRHGKDMEEGVQNAIYMLDTRAGVWTCVQHTAGTPPEARSYHAMTAAGTKLYVFGGCSSTPGGGRLSDLHEFDTETLAWRQLPSPSPDHIPGRGGSCLVASGNSLFVISGFCGHELGDMHEFSLVSESWNCPSCLLTSNCGSEPSGLPPRSVFGAVAHGCDVCQGEGKLVVFGGEVNPSDKGHDGAGSFAGDLWCFERAAGWTRVEGGGELPCPRGWFAETAFQGKMVLHGGLDGENVRLGDLYMLDLHADT